MPLTLRDYQVECADEVFRAIGAGQRRPAVILPTGAGKTVVFGEVVRRWLERHRGRVLVLAHRDELLKQAVAKLEMALDGTGLRVGLVKGQQYNGVLADVVVASEPTMRNRNRRAQVRDVGLVIVDECHHATAAGYRTVLDHFGCFGDDGAVALGFTATMSRGDKARLADVWPEVVYERDITWMIRRGYLVGVDGKRIVVPDLDLRKVKRMAGDYSDSALGAALEGSLAPEAIAKAYHEHALGKQGILFAPTVSSAAVLGQALEDSGVRTRLVYGAMDTDNGAGSRRRALDDFREGKVDVLASCMILTEGTDLPMAQVGIMARPTSVAALYVQMAGRVLRPHPGKTRALLLDVCGVTAKHSLISPVDLFGKELDAVDVDDDLLVMDCDYCGRKTGHDEGCIYAPELAGIELVDDAGGSDDQVLINGPIEAIEVDLFHGSKSAWLRTYAGYWFLSAGRDRLIAIVPGEDRSTYDVVWLHTYAHGHSGWVARGVPELAYAQAFAEGNLTAAEKRATSKSAHWRSERTRGKKITFAAGMGLEIPRGTREGEADDLIARHVASARIDPAQIQRAAQAHRVGV
jgi:superfamily II DNA or RNA helicase